MSFWAIRKGAHGLVLVLQPFVAHTQSEPIVEAAKEAGPHGPSSRGYGVQAVRLGVERFLGGLRRGGHPVRRKRPPDGAREVTAKRVRRVEPNLVVSG